MEFVKNIFTSRAMRRDIAASRDRLYAVALSWCGDAMVADDLVQETLVLSLQHVSQLRERDKLNAWMHSILCNCWKQYLRRMRPMVDIDEVNICCEGDAEAGSSEREIVELVRCAILGLPDAQRQTVTLVDLGGFSYAEVADILEVPIGTVMSRLYAARHKLQRTLSNIRPPGENTMQVLRRVK